MELLPQFPFSMPRLFDFFFHPICLSENPMPKDHFPSEFEFLLKAAVPIKTIVL